MLEPLKIFWSTVSLQEGERRHMITEKVEKLGCTVSDVLSHINNGTTNN